MAEVVGIRFERVGKIYTFDPGSLELNLGDAVVVETIHGLEMGRVAIPRREVADEDVVQPLKSVLRKATDEDRRNQEKNKEKAKAAFPICEEKIAQCGLEMKLVDVEYTFDNSKIIFYFTADGRVDFRELVKELASVFRTRIELKQIGIRDEAKALGGIGPCGRVLCCNSFLGDFEPVSIKAAKVQNLALNPVKISGICGKLMCCLNYEADTYAKERKGMPPEGGLVMTEKGEGKIREVDPLKKRLFIEIRETGVKEYFNLADVTVLDKKGGDAPKPKAEEEWQELSDLADEMLAGLSDEPAEVPERKPRRERRPRNHERREGEEAKTEGEAAETQEPKEHREPRERKPRLHREHRENREPRENGETRENGERREHNDRPRRDRRPQSEDMKKVREEREKRAQERRREGIERARREEEAAAREKNAEKQEAPEKPKSRKPSFLNRKKKEKPEGAPAPQQEAPEKTEKRKPRRRPHRPKSEGGQNSEG